jgi:hypothetical protein
MATNRGNTVHPYVVTEAKRLGGNQGYFLAAANGAGQRLIEQYRRHRQKQGIEDIIASHPWQGCIQQRPDIRVSDLLMVSFRRQPEHLVFNRHLNIIETPAYTNLGSVVGEGDTIYLMKHWYTNIQPSRNRIMDTATTGFTVGGAHIKSLVLLEDTNYLTLREEEDPVACTISRMLSPRKDPLRYVFVAEPKESRFKYHGDETFIMHYPFHCDREGPKMVIGHEVHPLTPKLIAERMQRLKAIEKIVLLDNLNNWRYQDCECAGIYVLNHGFMESVRNDVSWDYVKETLNSVHASRHYRDRPLVVLSNSELFEYQLEKMVHEAGLSPVVISDR